MPSLANSKMKALAQHTGKKVMAFDLTSQKTCPALSECQKYCYATKLERIYPSVLASHQYNFDALHNIKHDIRLMAELLGEMVFDVLGFYDGITRIHASGDFFHVNYFKAWQWVASVNPSLEFFGYTKVLPFLLKNDMPSNMHIQYSFGGIYDTKALPLILDGKLPTNFVVDGTWQKNDDDTFATKPLGGKMITIPLQVNKHDDFEFIMQNKTFGIKIH